MSRLKIENRLKVIKIGLKDNKTLIGIAEKTIEELEVEQKTLNGQLEKLNILESNEIPKTIPLDKGNYTIAQLKDALIVLEKM